MYMKDRLCRLSKAGKASIRALCLLTACGLTYSCSDEYKLDDSAPNWLGSSIYATLQSEGNFKNFVKLINDAGQKEVLSRTGSKTLFVATDDAFEEFYAKNATLPETDYWCNATSYDAMTEQQKKILLSSSMLDNPYQLEMMTSLLQNGSLLKGRVLRRPTSSLPVDFVRHYDGSVLPKFANEDLKDYWKDFREEGIYMALDNTSTMMTTFIADQMTQNGITDDDFYRLTKQQRVKSDVHVFDSKVVRQNITCQNGYINVMDRVVLPPSNMAEVIRTNGRTNIFSHMLERFSAPFYNSKLTELYKISHPEFTGKIYEKRYFSENAHSGTVADGYEFALSSGTLALGVDPDRQPVGEGAFLKYDPGWNEYIEKNVNAQTNMGAIFVPNDDAMKAYFGVGGSGYNLITTYGKYPFDEEHLLDNIDCIPTKTMNALVNNLMMTNFVSSVPSKFGDVKDSALDKLFGDNDPANTGKEMLEETILANNGAIYILKEVISPADYVSVMAPAYVSKDCNVFTWAVYNGTNGSNKIYSQFYTFLRAMNTQFSLFIPNDDALQYYYDPVSFSTNSATLTHIVPRVIQFRYTGKSGNNAVEATAFRYDPLTGTIMEELSDQNNQIDIDQIANRMIDIMESHTIIHEAGETLLNGNEFFMAKNGAPVQVLFSGGKPGVTGNTVTGVRGGFQMENYEQFETDLEVDETTGDYHGVTKCDVLPDKTFQQKNGWSYMIDAPIVSATRSVYDILKGTEGEDNPYSEFFELCNVNDEVIKELMDIDVSKLKDDALQREYNKYRIFATLDNFDYRVSFFNSYNYTIYVPTNDQILDAINNKKLPTWDDLDEEVKEMLNRYDETRDEVEYEKTKARLRKRMNCLLKFVKCHFQDASVYANTLPQAATAYETSALNDGGKFYRLRAETVANNNGSTDIKVCRILESNETKAEQGSSSVPTEVWATSHGLRTNVFARDIDFSKKRNTASTYKTTTISASSYTVIHQIDKALYPFLTRNAEGKYDPDGDLSYLWADDDTNIDTSNLTY